MATLTLEANFPPLLPSRQIQVACVQSGRTLPSQTYLALPPCRFSLMPDLLYPYQLPLDHLAPLLSTH